jgi:pimeloyl-ACP methyl ester carboxylesterase
VFVHGSFGSGTDWSDLVEQVGRFGRALAPDMPGFGRSDKPGDFDYTIAGYARHLGAVLDAEKVTRAHLVLHGIGAAWALAWAAGHVDRVASVTLLNTGVMPGYRWHCLARLWRRPVVGELFMAMISRVTMEIVLRRGNPRGLPESYLDEMYSNCDRAAQRAVLNLYRNTDDLGALTAKAGAFLAPHRLPALVLWGERDPYFPVRFADTQRLFFDVRGMLRLPDSGHWPMIDNPSATSDGVLPFLRAHVRRASDTELR